MLDRIDQILRTKNHSSVIVSPGFLWVTAELQEWKKTAQSVRQATFDAALLALNESCGGKNDGMSNFNSFLKPVSVSGTTTLFANKRQIVAEFPIPYLWNHEQTTEEMGDLLEVFYQKYIRLNGVVTYDWKLGSSYQFKKNGWTLLIRPTGDMSEPRLPSKNIPSFGNKATSESTRFLIHVKIQGATPLFLAEVIQSPPWATTKNPFFPGTKNVIIHGPDVFHTVSHILGIQRTSI